MRSLQRRLYAEAGRTRLAGCVAVGVVTAVLTVAQAWLLAGALGAVVTGGAGLAAIGGFVVGLVGVTLGRAGTAWAQEAVAARAASAATASLRERLLRRLAADRAASHSAGSGAASGAASGAVATLATRGLDALDPYFARYLPQLILAAAVPAVVLAAIASADLMAAATIVCTLPLIPFFLALVGRTTERLNRGRLRALGRLGHHFLDVVAGLPTLRAFGRAQAQAEAIRATTEAYRRATLGTLRLGFLSSFVLELLATIAVALVAVGVGLRLVGGALDLRTALLVLILAPEAYAPLRALGTHYHAAAEGLAAAAETYAVLDGGAERAGAGCAPMSAAAEGLRPSMVELRSSIVELRRVTVRYPGTGAPALHRCSLRLRPGEVLALTGPSGTGKSTVVGVLLGLVPPAAGAVRLGDAESGRLDLAAWRRQVAWVPQRPYLSADSIAENLRLGAPGVSDAALWRALELAGAAGFVAALPDGVHTMLGEAGRGLSAGQRQRLALARAYACERPVLLLDEPTSHLDSPTEAVVADGLARFAQGRTVLLVTHRPAVLRLAHRVVELDASRVDRTP